MQKLRIHWTAWRPIRREYARTYANINTVRQLKAAIRAGEFAWPGVYQLAFITSDGGLICFACAKNNFRSIVWSIKHKVDDGWRILACDTIEETEHDVHCDNCYKVIFEGE